LPKSFRCYYQVTIKSPIYLSDRDQSHATLARVMHSLNPNRSQSGASPASPAFNLPVLSLSDFELASRREAGQCPICCNFLSGAYYRVNGQTACAVCAIQARARKTSNRSFVPGVLLALGAALVCLALPFLVRQIAFQDAIGISVLLFGARIAWHFGAGRRLNLDGPYKASQRL